MVNWKVNCWRGFMPKRWDITCLMSFEDKLTSSRLSSENNDFLIAPWSLRCKVHIKIHIRNNSNSPSVWTNLKLKWVGIGPQLFTQSFLKSCQGNFILWFWWINLHSGLWKHEDEFKLYLRFVLILIARFQHLTRVILRAITHYTWYNWIYSMFLVIKVESQR